jgi:GRF zinc finger
MSIDRFTKAEFEAALPTNAWEPLGVIQGEETYLVKPTGVMAGYGIMVRSSVGESGLADECGEDSIRVFFARQEGETWRAIGNKAKAYTTRVTGWQRRLMEALHAAKSHLLRVRQCPKCQAENLTPFTSKKGKAENKGRGFVSCPDKTCGFFEWIDEESATTGKSLQEKNPTADSPICPLCKSGMVRNFANTGYRCNTLGNVWNPAARQWSKCQGVLWDTAKSLQEKTPTVKTPTGKSPMPLILAVRQAVDALQGIDAASAIIGLASLDVGPLADLLIDVGNHQAEQASKK